MSEIDETGAFGRWLYRNYRQGSAVSYYVRSRIRPAAWLLMGGGAVSALFGPNVEKSIVVLLSLLFLALLCVGMLWAYFRKAHISAHRELPRTATVGELLNYGVSVKNEGSRVLGDVFLYEEGDDPRPTEWEFQNLREPGEEKRNWFDRTFVFYRWKWLNERGGGWKTQGCSEGFTLDVGEVGRVNLSLMPLRRGVLKLNDLRAELPDPLGLFQRRRAILNEEDEVLVIPRRYRLPGVELGGFAELKMGDETSSRVRGDGGEFMGLREYREGDSLRKIHWKAWARTGQAIVKEFEEQRFPRYGLVLDTNLNQSGPSLFEEAVSVAASFVTATDRGGCLLDFMFVRGESEVFMAGGEGDRAENLLEILARVEGCDSEGYESLQKLVLSYLSEMAGCVVVLSGWSEERENFLKCLEVSGIDLRVYIIGAEERSEEGLKGRNWLRMGHVQEDLLKG